MTLQGHEKGSLRGAEKKYTRPLASPKGWVPERYLGENTLRRKLGPSGVGCKYLTREMNPQLWAEVACSAERGVRVAEVYGSVSGVSLVHKVTGALGLNSQSLASKLEYH